MPIIVPIEENHEGIAGLTDAKFRAPDYSGSGLEALGAGLTKFGEGGEQLAGALDDRHKRALAAIAAAKLDNDHQRNIDDAAVKQAYVDYSDPTHEALHGEDGLFNQQGAGAHAAFPGLVETLVDNHDKALSKLDDIQRAAVAPAMNERLRNDVDRAAAYVRQQGAAEQKWQSEQLQKAAARDAVNHADDPDLFDHHLATGENTIRQQAKIDNIGDKLLAKQLTDYKSGVHADTIEALVQRDPVHAAGWYARFGGEMNEVDRRRAEAMLASTPVDNQNRMNINTAEGYHVANRPADNEASFTSQTMRDLPFGADQAAQEDELTGLESDDASGSDGQAYSANASLPVDDGNPAPAAVGTYAASDAGASVEPIIAKGDGGAPMPIHMDMQPTPALGEWFAKPARRDQYVIDTPPDFITRFRRNHPDFVRLEDQTFADSKGDSWSATAPRERALLVYQSLDDPHKFVTRTVPAKDEKGIVFRDFYTNMRLPFGRYPQVRGFRLIIAEHTHPLPVRRLFGTSAYRGPSNLDVAMSKLHPDVYFLIRSAYSNDFIAGSHDESYYYGRNVGSIK